MSVPGTPSTSKVNEEINQIIDELNRQWGLQLPTRDQTWSPSKMTKNSTDERVLHYIRYLFFKDRDALNESISHLKEYASTAPSGWLFKPRAEPDVIPSREPHRTFRREEQLEAEAEKDEKITANLKACLFENLKLAFEFAMRGERHAGGKRISDELIHTRPSSRGNAAAEPPMLPALQPSKTTSPKSKTPRLTKQSFLEDFYTTVPTFNTSLDRHTTTSDRLTAIKPNHPSSDDFPSGLDDDVNWEDIPMPDAQTSTARSNSTEEEYKTPPSEPVDDEAKKHDTMQFWPTLVPERLEAAKKRPHPESKNLEPLSPRKASREKHDPLDSRSHNTNGFQVIKEPFHNVNETLKHSSNRHPKFSDHHANLSEDPLYSLQQPQPTTISSTQADRSARRMGPVDPTFKYPRLKAGNKTKISTKRDLSLSFGSTASFATTSTTTTTPATSFLSDSITTSFGSSLDQMDETAKINLASRLSYTTAEDGYSRASSEPPQTTQEDFGSSTDYDSVFRGLDVMNLDLESHPQVRLLSDVGRTSQVTHPVTNKMALFSETGARINGVDSNRYMIEHLLSNSPTAKWNRDTSPTIPFRQRYELERLSRSTDASIIRFIGCAERPVDDYTLLWSSLRALTTKLSLSLPEPSSPGAWAKAEGDFRNVSLSGDLKYTENPDGPLFAFTLRPLKIGDSYRLARKFGGDRMFTLFLPGLDFDDLPKYLRPCSAAVRDHIISWIVDHDHYFVGRRWRAFFPKPEAYKKGGRGVLRNSDKSKHRIFMFAVSGDDFRRFAVRGEPDPRCPAHYPVSIEDMVNWVIPPAQNRDQHVLKLFSRLAQAVSSTIPTVVFQPSEIVRSDDARADAPKERRLNLGRSHEKQLLGISDRSTTNVMNDGCARISRAAANDVAEKLGLTQTPSAFQARIGGAKGMWIVDALDERLPNAERDHWIEITDSQLKFQGHPEDNLHPDSLRMTFEVLGYSKKLCPSTLNFQFIPILEDRGVPGTVFERLFKDDLTNSVAELQEAMSDPATLRKWNQDVSPVAGERLQNHGVEMSAGLPHSLAERINWFVEHGFDPEHCKVLKDLCYRAVHDYCTQLENRMHIRLGRSTSAYMIADPLAILEEDEVHFGFANTFHDPASGWSDNMLHDIDLLVGRSPALLPSDIQKVRAVFKPELRMYKDVIVFPSKGLSSLADKLSGGDYDGDKAWICWDPSIVDPFQNASIPLSPPSAFYGLEADTLKVKDIIDQPNYLSRFLTHSFQFNLEPDLLGSCTNYHKGLCYARKSMHGDSTIAVAQLLGKLVDRPKQGYSFDKTKWKAFLKASDLPMQPRRPAYENKGSERPTNHILDRLVFNVAANIREQALGEFATSFGDASTWDDDLARLWNVEFKLRKCDQQLLTVRNQLKSDLETIFTFWKDNVSERIEDTDTCKPTKKGNLMTFQALVEHCRRSFLALQPCEHISHPVADRWRMEKHAEADAGKSWRFIKASAVFCLWHKNGSFAWYVAGPELGEIKAKIKGAGSYHIIVGGLYEIFKLDGKMLRRKQGIEDGPEQWGVGEKETDYGSDPEDFEGFE